jgi:hypothetical protein
LSQSLKYVYCSNNQLFQLPKLPQSLILLYCSNNKLPYPTENIQSIRKIQHFSRKYYTWKYTPALMAWMWRSRESIACREGHPERMWETITEAAGDIESAF